MRFILGFGLSGGVLTALAVRLAAQATGYMWLLVCLEFYLAMTLLSLAAIYGLREAGMNVEDLLHQPAWSTVIRAVLLPYLALGGITLYVSRWFDREGLLNLVSPGLYIGRLPFPSELGRLRAAGIGCVLNLCWEFPRLSGTDRVAGIETAHLPILDGSPPTDQQFEVAVRRLERWNAEGRCVLIHCAQGHGRTATVTGAVLIGLGQARNIEQALLMIKAARPLAKPSLQQKAALLRYVSNDASNHG